ncbi:TPA: hypothetical protein JD344_07820 [Serratia marcescens]|nr:hypothetical protein [Serratia marcescens]QHI80678.1 hypothetical protein GUC32_14950 [Serratia sp. NGAS9]TXE46604.1 hypothetical protein FOT55_20545 [Serratia bockelmannii]KAB1578682.1 hypothetical protein F7687_23280 [Serratia marcescens]NSM51341.1 hypothetical protein [Serratia marcescens]
MRQTVPLKRGGHCLRWSRDTPSSSFPPDRARGGRDGVSRRFLGHWPDRKATSPAWP